MPARLIRFDFLCLIAQNGKRLVTTDKPSRNSRVDAWLSSMTAIMHSSGSLQELKSSDPLDAMKLMRLPKQPPGLEFPQSMESPV